MFISMDVEKLFDKMQHAIMIKFLEKPEIKRSYLRIIKTIIDKPILNIILSEEKLKGFPVTSGM
jgi:hypothetical protein